MLGRLLEIYPLDKMLQWQEMSVIFAFEQPRPELDLYLLIRKKYYRTCSLISHTRIQTQAMCIKPQACMCHLRKKALWLRSVHSFLADYATIVKHLQIIKLLEKHEGKCSWLGFHLLFSAEGTIGITSQNYIWFQYSFVILVVFFHKNKSNLLLEACAQIY